MVARRVLGPHAARFGTLPTMRNEDAPNYARREPAYAANNGMSMIFTTVRAIVSV